MWLLEHLFLGYGWYTQHLKFVTYMYGTWYPVHCILAQHLCIICVIVNSHLSHGPLILCRYICHLCVAVTPIIYESTFIFCCCCDDWEFLYMQCSVSLFRSGLAFPVAFGIARRKQFNLKVEKFFPTDLLKELAHT